MRVPTRRGERKYDDDGSEQFLTPEGAKRLASTLIRLESEIPKAAEEKATAAALGDRSENAEYKDAKARLSGLHSRIESIKNRLKSAVVIKKKDSGQIEIGSTVTLEIENGNGLRKVYEIVGQYETNPGNGRISNKSPLGRALIGHGVNDCVTIKTPVAETVYRVVEIR
ncbi:MAG: GreA/GreB family elongation factor [bacterium]